eukprot:935100-Rhodomonas_salina.1
MTARAAARARLLFDSAARSQYEAGPGSCARTALAYAATDSLHAMCGTGLAYAATWRMLLRTRCVPCGTEMA